MSSAKEESIKELKEAVDYLRLENNELRSQINSLSDCVQSLCNNQLKSSGAVKINENTLFQNQPNPFNQSTVIRYQLTSNSNNVKIVIRDLNGRPIKSIMINETGQGRVTLNSSELMHGTYTYTLMIDNENIDTKLMVVTRE